MVFLMCIHFLANLECLLMLLTFDMDSIKLWQVCFTYFLQSLLSSQHPHFKT